MRKATPLGTLFFLLYYSNEGSGNHPARLGSTNDRSIILPNRHSWDAGPRKQAIPQFGGGSRNRYTVTRDNDALSTRWTPLEFSVSGHLRLVMMQQSMVNRRHSGPIRTVKIESDTKSKYMAGAAGKRMMWQALRPNMTKIGTANRTTSLPWA